jgi:hypothetical protein
VQLVKTPSGKRLVLSIRFRTSLRTENKEDVFIATGLPQHLEPMGVVHRNLAAFAEIFAQDHGEPAKLAPSMLARLMSTARRAKSDEG